jgi:uncharacterized membrane protein
VLRKQSDLLMGILLALVFLGLAVFGFLPPVLQSILALPFVLIVPGNALLAVLFPGSGFKGLERLLFVVGLSLAVTILSGLALNPGWLY